jgi:hypothetical protein
VIEVCRPDEAENLAATSMIFTHTAQRHPDIRALRVCLEPRGAGYQHAQHRSEP